MRTLALILAAAAALALAGSATALRHEPTAKTGAQALANLPLTARGMVSRVLGRDKPAYHARLVGGEVTITNAQQDLSASFTTEGVQVSAGTDRFGLRFRAAGYGDTLRPVAPSPPRAERNRVSYRRGALTEWYANGPFGLEQGFTLAARPTGRQAGPLTLALALAGNLSPTIARDRQGVTFTGSTLRYQGLTASDARGRRLRSWLELDGRTLLVRVADAGARYPLTIDPFVQQARLIPGDAQDGDTNFGSAVAVSGNTLVVGAEDVVSGGDVGRGCAYVFVKPASGWHNSTETAKLVALDGQAGDQLGHSVGVSGDTVVAGAPGVDADGASATGAVYVFLPTPNGWHSVQTQTAKLTASDAQGADALGLDVAVSGETVVAGGGEAAYVFVKPAGPWANGTETAKLTASSTGNNEFGRSVAISENTIVVGAPFADIGGVVNYGAAYIFVKPGGAWQDATETVELTASDGQTDDYFAGEVAISGDTVVAGAMLADIDGHSAAGAAYVFVKPQGAWQDSEETAKLTASDGQASDFFGQAVAVSGGMIVAGAPLANPDDVGEKGAAYVFVTPTGIWEDATESTKLTVPDGHAADKLGDGVAVLAGTVFAGAPGVDLNSNLTHGALYVFASNDSTPPTLTLAHEADNQTGWNLDAPVDVSVEAGDSDSGLAGPPTCTDSVNGAPAVPLSLSSSPSPFHAHVSGEGTHAIHCAVSDNRGNTATDDETVKIDTRAPVITFFGVRNYTVDETVSITCSAADPTPGSGLAETSCTGFLISHPAYSFPLGLNAVPERTASDLAGWLAGVQTSFRVTVTYASLCKLTARFSSSAKVTDSLCKQLNAAAKAEARGDMKSKTKALNEYRSQVASQSGKALTSQEAATLTQLSQGL
jgi:hypothetical protein